MRSTFALTAFAAVAYALPQGTTETLKPDASAPQGCSGSYNGKFQIAAVNTTMSKRDLVARQTSCDAEGSLTLTLSDTVLLDAKMRTGYIASNYQFQFDAPVQSRAIYTAGFSACSNGSLALGGSAVFYQCLSGGFYNLYDRHWAPQCNAITLQILPCAGSSGAAPPSGGVGEQGDGQPTGGAAGAPVTQISDGQPQAGMMPVTQIADGQVQAPPVTQIGDGQIQAPTGGASPVTQIGDGQVQAPTGTAAPVTQIGDGQVQAPTGVVSQIGDGQPQAPTGAAPVTQIGDGQIQAPTGTVAPVTQIGDGQVQAPTGVAPVTQISDGQIQAPTSAPAPVTQIGDGQVQAPANGTNTTMPSPSPIEANSGNVVGSSFAVAILGFVGVLFL